MKHTQLVNLALIPLVLSFSSTIASASDESVRIDGFVNVGYSKLLSRSDEGITEYWGSTLRGSAHREAKFGLNVTAPVGEKWDAVGQLVGGGGDSISGALESYSPEVQLLLLRFAPASGLQIRLGRQLAPMWLISEEIDIGLSYPWIRPPREVYSLNNIKTANGASASYNTYFGDFGLKVALFGGQTPISGGPSGAMSVSGKIDNIVAAELILEYQKVQLRGAYSQGIGSVELAMRSVPPSLPPGMPTAGSADFKTTFLSVGARGEVAGAFFVAEYARRKDDNSNQQGLMGAMPGGKPSLADEATMTGYYGTFGYNISDFAPHLTYAEQVHDRPNGYEDEKQRSVVAGLNYSVTPAVTAKLEWQQTQEGSSYKKSAYPPGQVPRNFSSELPYGEKVSMASVGLSASF